MTDLIDLPTMRVNSQELIRLLQEAASKKANFESKLAEESACLDRLKLKFETFNSIFEYAHREPERRGLLGLFCQDGEYGFPMNFPQDLLNEISRRMDLFRLDITRHEGNIRSIEDSISFISEDIELLKKINHLDLKPSFFEVS